MNISITGFRVRAVTFVAFFVCLAIQIHAGYLYVSTDSAAGNMIYGFSVNEGTGELALLSGFPIATGFIGGGATSLEHAVIDATNKRLYVVNRGSSNVSAYSIDAATGALTPLPFSPITTVANQRTLKIHPSGSPLIIGADTFASFVITPTSATAAPGSPYAMPTGVSPSAAALSPDGTYYYAGGNTGNFFAGYSINSTTGEMTALAGSPFDTGASNPVPFAIDSTGRLFVNSSRQALVRVYTLASGIPTGVTASPFAGTETGFASIGKIHPNGNFIPLPNRTRNHVYSLSIGGTGAATQLSVVPGSPVVTGGTTSQAGIFNDAGNFYFVANGTSRNITRFAVNAATGVLSDQFVQPANTLGSDGTLSGIAYLPTASAPSVPVSVAGRVTRSSGSGLAKTIVTIQGPGGFIRNFMTSSFGYYRFDNIPTGSSYTISVTSKYGTFSPQTFDLKGERLDVNFVENGSPTFSGK